MNEGAVETVDVVDDLDWDNVEDVAPTLEEVSEEGNDDEVSDSSDEPAGESEGDSGSDDSSDNEADSEEADSDDDSDSEEAGEDSGEDDEADSVDINTFDDDTVLKVKVDGVEQDITLKEFKSGISGQKAVQAKFNELDAAKKNYESELSEVNGYINTFRDKAAAGNGMLDAMSYIGEFAQISPHQMKAALIKELLPEIERMHGLDQSEIDLEYQTKENEYLKTQRDSEHAQLQKESSSRNLQSQVDNVRNSLEIKDDAEWNNAIAHLDEHLPKNEAITPELVGEYVQFDRADSQAESVLSAVDGDLSNSENVEILRDIIIKNPDFTEEDLKQIVNESLGNSKQVEAKAEIDKQQQKVDKQQKGSKGKASKDKPNEQFQEFESNDWDDIL